MLLLAEANNRSGCYQVMWFLILVLFPKYFMLTLNFLWHALQIV